MNFGKLKSFWHFLLIIIAVICMSRFSYGGISENFEVVANEKEEVVDSVTGRTVTFLTNGSYRNCHQYPHNKTWAEDDRYIIAESSRPRPDATPRSGSQERQLLALDTITGDIYWLDSLKVEDVSVYGSNHLLMSSQYHADYAPDTNVLVYYDMTGHNLYLMDFDTGQKTLIWNVNNGTLGDPPTISDDGTKVVVYVAQPGPQEDDTYAGYTITIYSIDINPATLTMLNSPSAVYSWPCIKAKIYGSNEDTTVNIAHSIINPVNLEEISFCHGFSGASDASLLKSRIWYAKQDGGLVKEASITPAGHIFTHELWGPKGKWIYYVDINDAGDHTGAISRVNPRTEEVENLIEGTIPRCLHISVSGDERRIVFDTQCTDPVDQYQNHLENIMLYDVQTQELTHLARQVEGLNHPRHMHPQITRKGDKVAFTVAYQNGSRVAYVDIGMAEPTLIGYWKMDDASGSSIAVDSSEKGNNAGIVGQVIFNGDYGDLQGSGDYLQLPNDPEYNTTTSFTWAAYIRTSAAYDQVIIDRSNSSGWVSGARIFRMWQGKLQFSVNGGAAITGTTILTDGKWHHVAVTYDDSGSGRISLYVDGNLENTAVADLSSPAELNVGLKIGAGINIFTGDVEEVRIYNIELEQSMIKELATMNPRPIGYWKLDDVYGSSIAVDSSDKSNNAGIVGPAIFNSDYGDLRGSGDYLQLPNDSEYDTVTSFTWSAYIRTSAAYDQVIIDRSNSGGWISGARIFRMWQGKLQFSINGGATITGTTILTDGQWHHVAVTYDDSGSGRISLYVDGDLENTAVADLSSPAELNVGLKIGAGINIFTGDIEEVRIYDVKLDQLMIKELATIMNYRCIGYWKLNDTPGSASAIDSGSRYNDADIVGPVLFNSDYGDFGGSGDYLQLPNDPEYDTTTSFTWSAYIRTSGVSDQMIIERSNAGWVPGARIFRIRLNKLQFSVYGGVIIGGTTTLTDGKWHHVAVTYDDSGSGRVSLYVDGSLENTAVADISSPAELDAGLKVGGGFVNSFNGDIEEVRIYDVSFDQLMMRELAAVSPRPIGYWRLDDASGSATAVDFSDKYNDAGVVGPVVFNSDYGDFGGSGDYLQLPNDPEYDTMTSFTWSAYIRTSETGDRMIIERSDTGPVSGARIFRIRQDKLQFSVIGGTIIGGTTILTDGQWHHVAVTYDDSGFGRISLYVDGNLENTTVADLSSPAELDVSLKVGGGIINSFNGDVEEVRIYDVSLDQMTIKELATVMKYRCIGYWKLDDTAGSTIVIDSGSRYNDANVVGPVVFNSDYGDFSGSGDYLQLPNDPEYDTMTSFTWAAYIRTSGISDQMIIERSNAGWVPGARIFRIRQNKLQFSVYGGIIIGGTTVLTDGQWHHVAVTYDDRGSGKISLYVDGNQETTGVVDLGSPLELGVGLKVGGGNVNSYSGDVEEVRIYDTCLDQLAIERLL